MLFGRRKKGFTEEKLDEFSSEVNDSKSDQINEEVEEGTDQEEKIDLSDYLDSIAGEEDDFSPSEIKKLEEEVLEDEETEEKTQEQLLAEFIRDRSEGAHVTAESSLEKEGQNLEDLLEKLKNNKDLKDIVSIKGDKDVYYYSDRFMSDNYAKIAVLVEDKDMAKTIAEMVRWNGKTYPCPTPLYYFGNSPYFYTKPQIERALKSIERKEEYNDIFELTTGNDVRYLYSTIHMSEKYARALAESTEYGEYGYH